jgi:hypothetical protein
VGAGAAPTPPGMWAGAAATWLPPQKSYRCEYVAAQVEVKAKYRLWVTPAEHDAIDRILSGCSSTFPAHLQNPDHP